MRSNPRTDAPDPDVDHVDELERTIALNIVAARILAEASELELPGWYLGAGGVTQTVWNRLHGFEPGHAIKDYDLVYFDPDDLSAEAERDAEERARRLWSDLEVTLDVKNEARVHIWYRERFGRSIEPYRSTEHAVSTWPSTASSVAVRYDATGFVVCSPFGLGDLFALVVRPNKTFVTREVYEEKVARWARLWPRLTIVPW